MTTRPAELPRMKREGLILHLLFVAVLLVAAVLRFNGLLWGEYQYLHPDERFLLDVGSRITPVTCQDPSLTGSACPPEQKRWISLGQYFDTDQSPLNPNNVGATFYVYGTLPMFITRFVVEWVFGHSGYEEMTQIGRGLSALADLLAVLLVYMTAARLFNRRVALLAAAFSALAVLQIQQSHFFTMDTFVNLFMLLAFYFAVVLLTGSPLVAAPTGFFRHPWFKPSLGFGIALGLAVASKLNAAPIAAVLPLAVALRLIALPAREREKQAYKSAGYLVMAALVSLLVFRIFQPYAFSGPGFFGLRLNPLWIQTIRELTALSGRDANYPPAMQWARRPVWFSFQNMVLWGMGLPFGILAWSGFIWSGWHMLRNFRLGPAPAESGLQDPGWLNGANWQRHALIWVWTGVYFVWQSLAANPTLRYQLPIYPLLAIFAAWLVVNLYDLGARRLAAGSLSQAPAFESGNGPLPAPDVKSSRLDPPTEEAASPVSGVLQTGPDHPEHEALPVADWFRPAPVQQSGTSAVSSGLERAEALEQEAPAELPGNAGLSEFPSPEKWGKFEKFFRLAAVLVGAIALLATAVYAYAFTGIYSHPITRLEASRWIYENVPGPINVPVQTGDGVVNQLVPFYYSSLIASQQPYAANFIASESGLVSEIYLPHVRDLEGSGAAINLNLQLFAMPDGEQPVAVAQAALQPGSPDPLGSSLTFMLSSPVEIQAGQSYVLRLEIASGGPGALALSGAGIANEGEWDDSAPWRMEGYDPFGGLYPQDMGLNMYTDDSPEKLARFQRILDSAEYVVITSSRQWGSLPRIPERFPMTSAYYRALIGCPEDRSIESCYNTAEPGMYAGQLGFELVKTFTSHPTLGPLVINDQPAEEAFTVYDHPKVFIFRKTENYRSEVVAQTLGSVDFGHIINLPPKYYGNYPAGLTLPEDRLEGQRSGGTWSELFDTDSLLNRQPWVGVVAWYLSLFLLGLAVTPLLRIALPGLVDGGYPMGRAAGLLLLSWLVWIAGSNGIPFEPPVIFAFLGLIVILGGVAGFLQRRVLIETFRRRRGYFLLAEILFLVFFSLDLLVRYGNPDLWHPWFGGEKPMDFSYFNAVLKSTTFPPYDPWYAGGYLNYYYYGFVFAGVLVKALGIVPAIAYNLILPSLFAMIAMGAFSLVWNLASHVREERGVRPARWVPAAAGIGGALVMALLGNLGTVRMIYQGYQRLAAPGGVIDEASLLTRFVWAFRGFVQVLGGENLPYAISHWYWNPSRVITAAQGEVEPITEFPAFTVLYADMHAHLFALPMALLVLAFVVSVVLNRARWASIPAMLAGFFIGALAIGALRTTNTWDFYPYLALASVALVYAVFIRAQAPGRLRLIPALDSLPDYTRKLLASIAAVLFLIVLSFGLYQPFSQWYGQGYNEVMLWEGSRTNVSSYLWHWGLFVFLIISWLAWETLDWMASTPLSSLRKLHPHRGTIASAVVLLALAVIALLVLDVHVAWLVLPLAAWAGVLILRPDQPDGKRLALFLTGTGLVLTLMVELIVLKGDIARMNTVFKFYLQVWTLFSIAAASAFGWLVPTLPRWSSGWKNFWQVGLILLVAGSALYPLLGATAKVKDRMAENAPHSLDGMQYMDYADYDWEGPMDLSQDYAAIRWMQENVAGSPVIVEANLRDLYRWGSRYSIYTGLPGVVGWEWHQIQQRAVNPGIWVNERVAEVDNFYTTTDLEAAHNFLGKYDVRYIVVGQLEYNHYPGPGLEKFTAANGVLWKEVFRNGNTVIYEVIPS